MVLKLGVIGAGMIGQLHTRRIAHALHGADITCISDLDTARAKELAEQTGQKIVVAEGHDLIDRPDVDAIVVTSSGPTHEQYVLAALAAGKPMFCEKPLATTVEACERILEAERSAGRRLVTVGFMRRYDDGYRAMKAAVEAGLVGRPLIIHSAHRNPSVPAGYTSQMSITEACVHDIDIARFLLDDEVHSTQVIKVRRPGRDSESDALDDPLLVVLNFRRGGVASIEISMNASYGYDIRGEVVGEQGTIELSETAGVIVKNSGVYTGRVPVDWRERFARAYDAELQDWIDGTIAGRPVGSSSWDGYAAAVVCDSTIDALASGNVVACELSARPAFY